jgi:hypothetical protein
MTVASVWERFLPRSLDNTFDGYRAALWLFGFVTLIRALQSVMIIFDGWNTVVNADGIPLDNYPTAAAQNFLALFAIVSLWRLIFCFMALVALIRYRSAVPLLFALSILSYLGGVLLSEFIPLMQVGTPPGPLVNFIQFVLMIIGLGFSLVPRRRSLQ